MRNNLLVLVLFICTTVCCYGFEGFIGRDAKDMACGFTSTPNSCFLGNPASLGEKGFRLKSSSSEIFDSGVFYDSVTAQLLVKDQVRFGTVLEKLTDRDTIDNSAYGHYLLTAGIAWKATKKIQLGLNIRTEKFNLQEEQVGKGLASEVGFYAGPWSFKDNELFLGGVATNIKSTRTYGDRVEVFPVWYKFNVNVRNSFTTYSVEVSDNKVLRLGIEYKPFDGLALRSGLIDGQPTYGFGFEKGIFRIDFAYWVAQAGGFYRISTSISL